MIRKLIKKHNNQIKSILSILLCLALIGGTITSMSVFAEEPATDSPQTVDDTPTGFWLLTMLAGFCVLIGSFLHRRRANN